MFALPISLYNFPNISTLKLSLKDHPRPLCTKLIRNIFRYVSLLKLRELDLAPPLTHPSANLIPQDHTDDATPCRSSIKSTVQRLKYLGGSIYDHTGFGGQRYFCKASPRLIRQHILTRNIPTSSLNLFSWLKTRSFLAYYALMC